MENLSLFSIGFRSENVCKVLRDYQAGKTVNKFIIDDSERVINECSQLIDTPVESLKENRRNFGDYLPLLYEVFDSSQVDRVQDEVDQVVKAVRDVAQSKPGVDVSSALQLFGRLSEICIMKTSEAPYPRVSVI